MSFIYNKNKRGPKIDPSGTPQVIDFKVEAVLLQKTHTVFYFQDNSLIAN